MPPLPASKFGQSVVIGRDARGGLFPASRFPARVTVELELRHWSELSGVHGPPPKIRNFTAKRKSWRAARPVSASSPPAVLFFFFKVPAEVDVQALPWPLSMHESD